MIVYRTGKKKYIDKLDGKGGLFVDGRWQTKGQQIIYTGSSMAISLLEVFKIISMDMIPDDTWGAEIQIPDKGIETFDTYKLSDGWNNPAKYLHELQDYGDKWLREKRSLVLRVPSAVVPSDLNFLINPLHKEINKVKIIKLYELDVKDGYLKMN